MFWANRVGFIWMKIMGYNFRYTATECIKSLKILALYSICVNFALVGITNIIYLHLQVVLILLG